MIIITDYKGFKLVLKQISAQNWSIFCTKQIKNDKLFLMQPENPIKFMLITVWTLNIEQHLVRKLVEHKIENSPKAYSLKNWIYYSTVQYSTYGMYYCIRIATVLKGTIAEKL